MNHLRDMYATAERLGFEYDEALDLAILTHDVIYDINGDNEKRSIAWLKTQALDLGLDESLVAQACAHINRTISHEIDDDCRIVALDLCSFAASPIKHTEDTRNVLKEGMVMRGISVADLRFGIYVGTLGAYLYSLRRRIEISGGIDYREGECDLVNVPEDLREHFYGILKGINHTLVDLEYAPYNLEYSLNERLAV